eukprot:scaffold1385_cov458-Pavlova_lutheri.AAC.1
MSLRVPSSLRIQEWYQSSTSTDSHPTGKAFPHILLRAAGVILYPAVSLGCMPTKRSRSSIVNSRRVWFCPMTQVERERSL